MTYVKQDPADRGSEYLGESKRSLGPCVDGGDPGRELGDQDGEERCPGAGLRHPLHHPEGVGQAQESGLGGDEREEAEKGGRDSGAEDAEDKDWPDVEDAHVAAEDGAEDELGQVDDAKDEAIFGGRRALALGLDWVEGSLGINSCYRDRIILFCNKHI